MRLSYDDETEAFRAELVEWLEANKPSSEEQLAEKKKSSGHLPKWASAWQRRLYDAGWLVPGWPPELGGRNATPAQTMVYFEELSRRQIPRALNPQGLGIIAPSLLTFGTDEQRERWLVPTVRGEITWALGMSEPGAGSDLAGLRTKGVLESDGWHVSGQKVWTSGAQDADWLFCFCRTEPDLPKHKGISVLVIDLKSPGIRVRPLPELTDPDQADFNEVFLDDVVVPESQLIGERGQGWPISMGSLGHERGMLWIGQQNELERDANTLIELGQTDPALGSDARFREQTAEAYIDALTMKVLGYTGFAKFVRGEAAPEHMILKLYGATLHQKLYDVGLQWSGLRSFDRDAPAECEQLVPGPWADAWLHSFAHTIAGGTNEVQRNIISERLLGLPR